MVLFRRLHNLIKSALFYYIYIRHLHCNPGLPRALVKRRLIRDSMKQTLPTLEELLKKGVHFGHKQSKWHPNMEQFIHTSRNGIHIIDLQQTLDRLKVALEFLYEASKSGKTTLFVGTKKAIKEIVKANAIELDLPYVTERWLGGTITNFSSINGLVKKLDELEKQAAAADYEEKYNKKERHDFSVAQARLIKMIGGIRSLKKIPDILFITDRRIEKTAVREAQMQGVKVVSIVDTNVNPDGIDYPIPSNDDSIKAVEMMVKLAMEATSEGIKARKGEDNAPKRETTKSENKPDVSDKEEISKEKGE